MSCLNLDQRVDLGSGWQEALSEELRQPYMQELAAFLRQERQGSVPVYPPSHQVFNALRMTPLGSVRVVIVGQDPYHGAGQAHGLCFSVPKGVPFPPSLRNIFQELQADVGIPPPPHGDLTCWAKQGVLLLNTTLTVRAGQPHSHYGKGWERFTDAIIKKLAGGAVIFVLWGRSAKDKVQHVLKEAPNVHPRLLTSAHPSPLSAYHGFFGCRHFSKINQLLQAEHSPPIDWTIH